MDIVAKPIDDYLHKITPPRHEVLMEMEKLAAERNFPIVGPLVGRILFQYARILNAKRILELGSGYGYSAFWWGLATPDDAQIYCTEGSAENIRLAMDYLERAGLASKVEYFQGDALESMDRIPGEFDIVFMDIDKEQYPEGFQKVFPRLRKGGLFIIDNVLWSGKIVEGDNAPSTKGILKLNQLIYNTPDAFTTILPIRDGDAVVLKL
ncbi:O-methyltransferase [bacterium]|nr:O-methyltransferase [bacterium]